MVYIDYVAKVKDTGEVLEVTREEDAKSLSVHDASTKYRPRLVSVGDGWVMKGLDESLLKAGVGEKLTVEITPEKGFGERDPAKVRLIPLRKFGDDASKLRVGEQVEVDNRVGIVRFIGSGRVQMDFNHRLAGKSLTYDLHLLKTVTEPADMIRALVLRRVPTDEEKVKVDVKGGVASVELPQEVFFADGLQYTKRAVSDEIFKHAKGVGKVTFIESFESPEAKAEEAEAPKPKRRPSKKKKA